MHVFPLPQPRRGRQPFWTNPRAPVSLYKAKPTFAQTLLGACARTRKSHIMNIELLNRIDELIKYHLHWAWNDFIVSQTLLWVAILSSFAASICASRDKIPKWLIATIAGLPALMLMVEKTFRYIDRNAWHDAYTVDLQALRDELAIAQTPQIEVAKRLSALNSKMRSTWPCSNPAAIPATTWEPVHDSNTPKVQPQPTTPPSAH